MTIRAEMRAKNDHYPQLLRDDAGRPALDYVY